MFIGSEPTRVDAQRLRTFHAVAADTVDAIQDDFDSDVKEYGEAVALALAYARAQGYQSMAQLLLPHESFDSILESSLYKFIEPCGHWQLVKLGGGVEVSSGGDQPGSAENAEDA